MSDHIETIRAALVASYHIAECGEHPEHLLDAENRARAALAALHALVAELVGKNKEIASLRDQLGWALDEEPW